MAAPSLVDEFLIMLGLVPALLAVRNELVGSLPGMGLIALCVSPRSRLSRALGAPVLQWLGSISYSLYLLHVVVLNAVLASPIATLPCSVILVTVVVLSLPVGAASDRLIERPGITLGRLASSAGRPSYRSLSALPPASATGLVR